MKDYTLTIFPQGTAAFSTELDEEGLKKVLDEMREGKKPDGWSKILIFDGPNGQRFYISAKDIGYFRLMKNGSPS